MSLTHIRTPLGAAISLAGLITASAVQAQAPRDPVHWTFTSQKLSGTAYELHMTATIDPGWCLFAQEGGGVDASATRFKVVRNPAIAASGTFKESGRPTPLPVLNTSIKPALCYQNRVDFVQTVTKTTAGPATLKGFVDYQASGVHRAEASNSIGFSINLN